MKKPIKVCTISMPYAERTVERNIELAFGLVEEAASFEPDIVCLPELTPFIGVEIEQALQQADSIPGWITDRFAAVCRRRGFWLVAGTFEKRQNHFYNACFLLDEAGQVQAVYHKMFPTIGELEGGVVPGEDAVVFDSPWGRLGFAICFDLNFAEVTDSLGQKQAKLVLFPSFYHGGRLATAASLSGGYYLACAKVMGEDGAGGYVADPLGKIVETAYAENPILCRSVNLDFVIAHQNWNKKAVAEMQSACGADVLVEADNDMERVKITSLSPTKTAREMAREFGVELLADYLSRARELRRRALSPSAQTPPQG